MDQGDAAVWAAGIGVVVGALAGALGGFFAGRAQAKATVDGVKLSVSGERTNALWEGRKSAYASFLAGIEEVRMKLVHLAQIGPTTSRGSAGTERQLGGR